MKKLIAFLKRSRNWLESDAFTAFLANPLRSLRDYESAGARVVVIAVDVSPSMDLCDYRPTRLAGAKRAIQRYLATLSRHEPETWVGLVVFHGEAELATHPLEVGSHQHEFGELLMRVHVGWGTNIGGALELAGRELAGVCLTRNPTVILLTDGESNQGPDPVAIGNELKARGVQLDIIGVGGSPAEVNEKDLKRIASVKDGQLRYWFIESADSLVERFEALALRKIG
jgi:Mg-chelatase subunit ChlD